MSKDVSRNKIGLFRMVCESIREARRTRRELREIKLFLNSRATSRAVGLATRLAETGALEVPAGRDRFTGGWA